MRKSIVNQSEIAFQAYVQAIIAGAVPPPPENPAANITLAGPVAFPMTVYAFQQVIPITNPNPGQTDIFANLSQPSISFQASSPEQYGLDSGVYTVKLNARIQTQTDDEMNVPGQDIHHQRVEALRDCLEDYYWIATYINAPASGPDTRTVQDFTLSSILFEEEIEENKDRSFVTEVHYSFDACPQ